MGIEMELWVVDEDGRLCGDHRLADAHERIVPEFIDPLLEVQTEPHDDVGALERDFRDVLAIAIEAAEDAGRRLVPLGTPLTAENPPANCERGRLFETVYGDGVVSAKNCAGTHVHFEKSDTAQQFNLLTALDPTLALVNSSPYYLGRRREDSSRAMAYRTKCGPEFRAYCDLWSYVESVEAWDSRVDRAFEEFVELAVERGVPRRTVEEFFSPADTVLNPVRIRHSQPTVEWRAPDAALPSQVLRLAADVGELMGQLEEKPLEFGSAGIADDRIRIPEFPKLWPLSREAIERGLGAERVEAYLRRMGFSPGEYRPISRRLRGPSTLPASKGRELRLEYAERLRADVETPTVGRSPRPVESTTGAVGSGRLRNL